MRHRLLPVISLLAAQQLLAPVNTAALADEAEISRGSKIVQQNCARCHATGRSDASRDPKAPPLRSLAKKYPLHFLAEALAEGITTGHNDMPEFVFDPEQIDSILAYLGSISEAAKQ